MKNESIIILYWNIHKDEGLYPLFWFYLIENYISNPLNGCDLNVEADWDEIPPLSTFSFANYSLNLEIHKHVSPLASLIHLNRFTAHKRYTVPYSFRFSPLFLFPEVAQLHKVLEEIILYIEENVFLIVSWLFSPRCCIIKLRENPKKKRQPRNILVLLSSHFPLLTRSTCNKLYVQNV